MHKHTAAAPVPTRKVVDAFTRTLHALMALSFGLAYITGDTDGWRWVHVTMGYTLGAAFLLRVVWGVWGPRRVALRGLWGRLSGASRLPELVRHLDAPALLKLLLPLSMVAVLVAMLPVVASGYATYFRLWGEWMEDVHEFFGNAILFTVLAHLGLIAGLSLLRRANLVRPMWSGTMPGAGPDLVTRPRRWLAALLLLAVLGFGVSYWQQAAQDAPPASLTSQDRDHDDDD